MHVHAHACIHTCIWRPEDDSQRLPQLLTTLCIEVDLSQNPEPAISASPPNRFVQAISCFYQIDIQIKWIYRWSVMSTWLLHGFWGSGVWLHGCILRTLPTEPSSSWLLLLILESVLHPYPWVWFAFEQLCTAAQVAAYSALALCFPLCFCWHSCLPHHTQS